MNNKYKKKKILQNAGERSILHANSNNIYDELNSRVVCEDIGNESDGGNSTLCYEDKIDKNKRDRIK